MARFATQSHRTSVPFPEDNFICRNVKTLKVENLAGVDLSKPLHEIARATQSTIQVEPSERKKYVAQQVRSLISQLQQIEEETRTTCASARDQRDKRWKARRQYLFQIEEMGGHKALDFKSFHLFVKTTFPGHFGPYFEERLSARYETLLGLPLCTYGRTFFKPLNALGIFPRHQGNQWKETIEPPPPERKLELLKLAWEKAQFLAHSKKRDKVNSEDLFLAVESLHQEFPEEVGQPASFNTSAKEKLELRLLRERNAQLERQNIQLYQLVSLLTLATLPTSAT